MHTRTRIENCLFLFCVIFTFDSFAGLHIHKKKMFDHADNQSRFNCIWKSIGTWTRQSSWMLREQWNNIKHPCHPYKNISGVPPQTLARGWRSRKCEHELILFECKINYAKTFELIFIAIHLHYQLLYFLWNILWFQKLVIQT